MASTANKDTFMGDSEYTQFVCDEETVAVNQKKTVEGGEHVVVGECKQIFFDKVVKLIYTCKLLIVYLF